MNELIELTVQGTRFKVAIFPRNILSIENDPDGCVIHVSRGHCSLRYWVEESYEDVLNELAD